MGLFAYHNAWSLFWGADQGDLQMCLERYVGWLKKQVVFHFALRILRYLRRCMGGGLA